MHRRHLFDLAEEACQRLLHRGAVAGDLAHVEQLAFGVARARARAQAHFGVIGLVRFQQVLRELGGFAEA